MGLKSVSTPDAPAPAGAYSQAVIDGPTVYLAGQGPFTSDGRLVNESFTEQVRQVFMNLEAVASAAGASLADAVSVRVYLSDLKLFAEMDRCYREVFREPYPARTTLPCGFTQFDIEVDAVLSLRLDSDPG